MALKAPLLTIKHTCLAITHRAGIEKHISFFLFHWELIPPPLNLDDYYTHHAVSVLFRNVAEFLLMSYLFTGYMK